MNTHEANDARRDALIALTSYIFILDLCTPDEFYEFLADGMWRNIKVTD